MSFIGKIISFFTESEMKKLFKLLLEYHIENGMSSEFICVSIGNMSCEDIITDDQAIKMLEWFHSQRPTETLHSEFYESSLFIKNSMFGVSGAWFLVEPKPNNKAGYEIRVKLLKKLVSLL